MTSQLFAGTSAVPVSAPDAIVPLAVVAYVNVVVVGTVAIVNVPLRPVLVTAVTVTLSPTRKPCADDVVSVAVVPVRAAFEIVFVRSGCHS